MEERAPSPLVPLPARIAVLISGRGSNFEALADACARGEVPGQIAVVVSDNPEAAGLDRARERGIQAIAIPRAGFPSKQSHEEAIRHVIADAGAQLVCLAGFMRVLSPSFIAAFRMRILNIHPSLLPSFPGLDAQAQAVRYGVRVSGATVHFVDAGTDTGPIVEQDALTLLPGEDSRSLSGRILEVEHRLYARGLRKVLEGGWILKGRRVLFPEGLPAKNP